MPQILTARTTSHLNTETRLGRDVSSDLVYLYPNVAPLITFFEMFADKRKVPTRQAKYEWFETDYTASWVQNGSTACGPFATATLMTVTDGTVGVIGDCLAVPNAISSSAKPEIIRIVGKPATNSWYVTRGIGSTTIGTIAADASLTLLGPAYEEGSAQPASKSVSPVAKYNYIQVFRKTFNFTEEAMTVESYAAPGGDFEREKLAKAKEHQIDINRAFLFGTAHEDLTGGLTGNPLRMTGGLNSVITTNVVDGSTTLTESKFREFCRTVVQAGGGSETKYLLAAPIITDALDFWATSKLHMGINTNKYGLKIREVEMGGGIFMVVTDRSLASPIATKNGFGGWAFAIDPDAIKMRVLTGNGLDGNTKYDEYDRKVKSGTFAVTGEYSSKIGLQVENEKLHGKLYNVSAFS